MTLNAIKDTLEAHGVSFIEQGSSILAIEEYFNAPSETIDVTGYSIKDLRHFLGYDDIPEYEIYSNL